METLAKPAVGSEARLTSPPDQVLHHADYYTCTNLIMFPKKQRTWMGDHPSLSHARQLALPALN